MQTCRLPMPHTCTARNPYYIKNHLLMNSEWCTLGKDSKESAAFGVTGPRCLQVRGGGVCVCAVVGVWVGGRG